MNDLIAADEFLQTMREAAEKADQDEWEFRRMAGFDDLHRLRGTTPEEHEGYFRTNNGSWAVGTEDGRVALVDFKGKAKRGQGYVAPDPEGMANAAHIATSSPKNVLRLIGMVPRWIDCNQELPATDGNLSEIVMGWYGKSFDFMRYSQRKKKWLVLPHRRVAANKVIMWCALPKFPSVAPEASPAPALGERDGEK